MASVHWDNLDVIGDRPILVHARMRLLTTAEGGRRGPIKDKYRPNHNFGGLDDRILFIGQIELGEDEWMSLGETRDVIVRFINVRGLAELLTVGRSWRIQEGPTLVGTAEVLSVRNEA